MVMSMAGGEVTINLRILMTLSKTGCGTRVGKTYRMIIYNA